MSTAPAAAALLAAATVLAAGTPRRPPGTPGRARAADPAGDPGWLRRLRIPLCCLAFVAGWVFVGGVAGLAAGLAATFASWRVLGRTESPAERRRRERLQRDLPVGVQLLAGCMTAGSAIGPALAVVAEAMPGPLGDAFARLHHRLGLGVDPALLWRELGTDEQLGPLGRCFARTHDSGASVTTAVDALADELRTRRRVEVEQRARSVDVRASAPLGACLLPAFVLLGVVPLVAGIFTGTELFG